MAGGSGRSTGNTRRRRERASRASWLWCLALALMLAWLAPLAAAGTAVEAGADGAPLRIGSKRFTESYILGELLTRSAAQSGKAEHRAGLGNTAIVLAALRAGEIDVYPEYTGTILSEIASGATDASPAALSQALAGQGLAVGVPLGFADAYALALPRALASRLGIHRLADLAQHRDLHVALSAEFLQRHDAWPAIVARYGLRQAPRAIEHALAYPALADGAIDLTDVYTTDAQLARQDLEVLADPDHILPPYDAVLLYRRDLPLRHPAQWQAITGLAGRIDARAMAAANARVDLDHLDFPAAAAELAATLDGHLPAASVAGGKASHSPGVAARAMGLLFSRETLSLTLRHLELVVGPVLVAILVGIPSGILAHLKPHTGKFILALVSILQTVPALALLALLIAVTGKVGLLPALLALFLYALLPIVASTHAGLEGIDRNLREAAVALGAPPWRRLLYIELPAAATVLWAGIRTAAVINVGGATLAAFVGAGGYGERVVSGLATNDPALLIAGALPSALLALVIQLMLPGPRR